ncbi:MAG: hypothetical protein ACT4QC_18100 [Planctomycetaceae bacterium]
MTRIRTLILLLGPVVLIGTSYALSRPTTRGPEPALGAHLTPAESLAARSRATDANALARACSDAASALLPELPPGCRAALHPPFVLTGTFSSEQLSRLHDETVRPITEALWRSYFDRRPDQPVVIVAARNELEYFEFARRLDGYDPAAYAGYTQRSRRRIVFNAATGTGTLAHELAHVLATFDFPEMPEWFDEGLAALHEDAHFAPDGLTLLGQQNGRSRLLAATLRNQSFPELATVVRSQAFRGEGEGLNYAYVRGLCLYLEERGLLAHFYRKFRSSVHDDPSGLGTLCDLLAVPNAAAFDQAFKAWVATRAAERADR